MNLFSVYLLCNLYKNVIYNFSSHLVRTTFLKISFGIKNTVSSYVVSATFSNLWHINNS